MKKKRLFNQRNLSEANQLTILKSLGFTCITEKGIQQTCPIHLNSDNPTAFSYNINKGVWSCFTHSCEKEYGSDLLGLVRSIKKLSFVDAVNWINETIGLDPATPSHISIIDNFADSLPKTNITIPNQKISELIQDYSYLKSRGFSPEIIKKFEGGLCLNNGAHDRFMLPVRNYEGELVGFTGRSIYDKCPKCERFHNKNKACPSKYQNLYVKWFHFCFSKSVELYNIHSAKKFIREAGGCILVEGPLDVMALVQSGYNNVVSCFGTSLSFEQACMLSGCGCLNIKTMFDGDEAGVIASNKLIESHSRHFKVDRIELPPGVDPADLLQCKQNSY